jgi:hypothetical protein
MMEMVYEKYSTRLTEFIGTALSTILPILFQYCYKCCYSDNRSFFSKKGGPLENISYDFFFRIVNNDGYICVVTLEIVNLFSCNFF